VETARRYFSSGSPGTPGEPESDRMNLILCHNFYQQPGGEDQVFAEEADLLAAHGHNVRRFTLHNDAIKGEDASGTRGMLGLMGDTVWNRRVYRQLRELVRRHRARVVHFHNTFPLMSPAAYYAARAGGAAVVQTLHNYRLICPAGTFFRDGKTCEECLGRSSPWPALLHKCYRDSLPATGVAAAMLTAHRAIGTYRATVDLYVALTEFARQKFIRGGLPAGKIVVKPNFVGTDRGAGDGVGNFGLFVGRLDASKGLDVLLKAWEKVPGDARLKILGDGPLAPAVREAAARDSRIEWLGRRPLDVVYDMMGQAAFLVISSVWYEGLPRTVVESFSKGTPIIASKLGALEELVRPGETGWHFEPNDSSDLARRIAGAFASPQVLQQMRRSARREYEAKYTANDNFRQMMALYARALEIRNQRTVRQAHDGAEHLLQVTLRGKPIVLSR
jgi:glycosyltransferase involved in cell wall biosynthesis